VGVGPRAGGGGLGRVRASGREPVGGAYTGLSNTIARGA
jgi:hypothetical protein